MTTYVIQAYSESAGSNVTFVGTKEADTPRKAVMKYLEEETNRTVQLRDGTGQSGYTAIPKSHMHQFHTFG